MKAKLSILLAAALAFAAFAGCDSAPADNGGNGGDPSNVGGDRLPGPAVQVGQGSGWPAPGKLSEYSHTGWPQPEGLDGVTWTEKKMTDTYYQLEIAFTSATSATKAAIDAALAAWVSEPPNLMLDGQEVSVTYVKRGSPYQYGVIVYYKLSTGGYIIVNRVHESDINPLASAPPGSGAESTFHAKILEIVLVANSYVLVEPLEGEAILHISDRISFTTYQLEEIGASVGDNVTVVYVGAVNKSYPAQINAVRWSIYK